MALEVINKNQQVIRAGLRPRTAYSRIIVLELTTVNGLGVEASQESAVLGSRGIVHKVWIHAHGRTVNQVQSGIMQLGIGMSQKILFQPFREFRQALIVNCGGQRNGLTLTGTDHDTELDMGVEFIGDKTKLGVNVVTNNTFISDFQVFFQISEG